MKTDLAKILSVSGRHGLYRYVAQARGGVIAESLADGTRTVLDARSRITTLADIAIYTSAGEKKLSEVFTAVDAALAGAAAPGKNADDKQVREVFSKAVPDYDADRFYLSHMRKILDWYSELLKYASLDFVEEESQDA